eukprot:jgi/Chlat1/2357/Chrsp17S02629
MAAFAATAACTTAPVRALVSRPASLRPRSVAAARPLRAAVAGRRRVTCMAASAEQLEKVRSIISEQLGTDLAKVAPDSKFVDLGADSLDTVEIMMALEEQFKISLDEDSAQSLETVQEAADLIAKAVEDTN